jgi:hypothetical protein
MQDTNYIRCYFTWERMSPLWILGSSFSFFEVQFVWDGSLDGATAALNLHERRHELLQAPLWTPYMSPLNFLSAKTPWYNICIPYSSSYLLCVYSVIWYFVMLLAICLKELFPCLIKSKLACELSSELHARSSISSAWKVHFETSRKVISPCWKFLLWASSPWKHIRSSFFNVLKFISISFENKIE